MNKNCIKIVGVTQRPRNSTAINRAMSVRIYDHTIPYYTTQHHFIWGSIRGEEGEIKNTCSSSKHL